MKVLLVQPHSPSWLGYQSIARVEPLGIESLAAALRGHEVRLADLRNGRSLAAMLDGYRPNPRGISCSFTMAANEALAVLTPLPGIRSFKDNVRSLQTDYDLFDFMHAVLPTRLLLSEFYEEFAGLYRSAHSTRGLRPDKVLGFARGLVTRKQTVEQVAAIARAFRGLTTVDVYLRGHRERPVYGG